MKRWKILARVLVLMMGPAAMAQAPEVPQAQRPAPQHRMGIRTGEQLTATREDGQPVRLTVLGELPFLVGPDFTPQKP